MESEKKTKLSLSDPDPQTDFQAFVLGSEEGAPSPEGFAPKVTEYHPNVFRFAKSFLSGLEQDPDLAKYIDRMVEQRVQDWLKNESEKRLADVVKSSEEMGHKAGYATGYQTGWQTGKDESSQKFGEAIEKLNLSSQALLDEKEKILFHHEKLWAEALLHLLKRLMVPHQEETVRVVREWLQTSLERFSEEKKVKIYVSPDTLGRLGEFLGAEKQAHWEFASDARLTTGEIRCETTDEGIFFSSANELAHLEGWVEKLFPEHGK